MDAGPSETRDEDAGIPDTDARSALHWLLDALAKDQALTEAEIQAHFAPEALAQASPPVLLAELRQLAAMLRPIKVSSEKSLSDTSVQALLDAPQGPVALIVAVEAVAPHRIVTLVVRPVPPPIDPPTSYAEASMRLAALASSRQLLIAELVSDQCKPVEEVDTQAQLAIGSAFKLWVLLALDAKLHASADLGWDSQIPVQEALKSLPSGTLQTQPAGTLVSLRKVAQQMISISDNTAADHLIDFVGRTAVEDIQVTVMHSHPAANIPWLYTREMFALKLWATPAQLDAYRAGSVADKRMLLDTLRSTPLQPDKLAGWTGPRALDLEWFASAMDLCNVLKGLASRAQFDTGSELLEILAINPGVAVDSAQYHYIGYKGGSEPGVLSLSWLVQRADGRWFVVAVILNDNDKPIDEDTAVQLASGVLQLLSEAR